MARRRKAPPRPGARKPRSKPSQRFPPEPLTRPEVFALLASCAETPSGVRDRALILFIWRTGLRCAEALAVRPKDIDARRGLVRVLRGKGDKMRTVAVDADTLEELGAWRDARQEFPVTRASPLFCNRRGQEMTTAYLRQLLPALAEKAGIDKRVHAHGLRHTHALELAEEGLPINVIQQQLGHSNASTTSTYLQQIAPQQVLQAMKARPSWRDDQ